MVSVATEFNKLVAEARRKLGSPIVGHSQQLNARGGRGLTKLQVDGPRNKSRDALDINCSTGATPGPGVTGPSAEEIPPPAWP
jgi:hypothetical protein